MKWRVWLHLPNVFSKRYTHLHVLKRRFREHFPPVSHALPSTQERSETHVELPSLRHSSHKRRKKNASSMIQALGSRPESPLKTRSPCQERRRGRGDGWEKERGEDYPPFLLLLLFFLFHPLFFLSHSTVFALCSLSHSFLSLISFMFSFSLSLSLCSCSSIFLSVLVVLLLFLSLSLSPRGLVFPLDLLACVFTVRQHR